MRWRGTFVGRRLRGRTRRPFVWLYRSSLQKSGLFMRGQQLSAMVRDLAGDRVDIGYVDETEIGEVRDSVIFTMRGFLAEATAEELAAIRRRNNVICVDYLDFPTRPELDEVVDVYVASSVAQRDHYLGEFPDKLVHLITHHADPATVGVQAQQDRCSIGYFGELPNARHRAELEGQITFVQTNNSEKPNRGWIDSLPDHNVHYSVREWHYPFRGRKPGQFKPFTKGFTAAQCHANIIVPADESDASHYLGSDYPYLLADDSLEAVTAMVEHVKESFGSKEWLRGLEAIAAVREASSPQSIVKEVEELVRLCS